MDAFVMLALVMHAFVMDVMNAFVMNAFVMLAFVAFPAGCESVLLLERFVTWLPRGT
jgi:hypothetical protein